MNLQMLNIYFLYLFTNALHVTPKCNLIQYSNNKVTHKYPLNWGLPPKLVFTWNAKNTTCYSYFYATTTCTLYVISSIILFGMFVRRNMRKTFAMLLYNVVINFIQPYRLCMLYVCSFEKYLGNTYMKV